MPDTPLDPLLSTVLDKGEAAVITLARSLSADVVLIDESKARKIARTIYGLRVIGSARVLVEAKRHCMLDNVAAALQAMREYGYWIQRRHCAVCAPRSRRGRVTVLSPHNQKRSSDTEG